GLPRAPEPARLLLLDGPRSGPLWTAGNPGALPFQVPARWSMLRLGGALDDGGYRRPMDPDDVGVVQFAGLGWERVGSAGAAIGRVVFDQEMPGAVPFTDMLEPHGSNP
ncbi:MAG: hypothetical protein GWN71_42300, partial [Gammaproteobacteria bacterium]|nr:hypothetical protein [Gemmatimonadota bacterium]NIU79934.1 hypothetical protein [Gammaproteobacteria bacterium]NIX22752.1 hypothetical protein [Actinomycetota bacterium]